ncbi:hypothetical protein EP30_05460 [Bifidobacterium sp. UTCIF-39]|uniref:hypothetical protein n=1 Tax=Bifidobacterium sp. UTCIF-39 TaxID=1465359 RepID=UPI00112A21DD|nr:hypothetical protein [Bifidobacterium sp. UTCIF-39]TPF96862.1 hypothetical protein EP30_05460 [Bifidobacterium sp. UTCIF-39]
MTVAATSAPIAMRYLWDGDFDSFVNDESATVEDLLDCYSDLFEQPFFNIEAQGPFVTDNELRRWVAWCLFYGRPRDEYPLANQD